MTQGEIDKNRKKHKPSLLNLINWKWVGTITALSFLISVSMSYLSNEALETVDNVAAFFILLLFVAIGIVFDIIGVAATSTTERSCTPWRPKRCMVPNRQFGFPAMRKRLQASQRRGRRYFRHHLRCHRCGHHFSYYIGADRLSGAGCLPNGDRLHCSRNHWRQGNR